MPVTTSLDPEAHVVTLTFTGNTGFAEWKAAMDAVRLHEHFVPGMCIISDRRDARDVRSATYIRSVVAYLKVHTEAFDGCGVAVVTGGLADFGMSRMAELLAGETGVRVRAFRDMDAAREWLSTLQPD